MTAPVNFRIVAIANVLNNSKNDISSKLSTLTTTSGTATATATAFLKDKTIEVKRINELNNKLRKELSRERITASNACLTIINYTSNTKDYTLPELWGYPVAGSNHFIEGLKNAQKNSQMSNSNSVCCTLM